MKLASDTTHDTRRALGDRTLDPDRLDGMLAQLEDEHTHLIELASAHKDALSHASVSELNTITMKTSEVLVRIAQIEDNRRAWIINERGTLSTLDELMEHFESADRDRIGQRRTRLRKLILRVKKEQDEVRQASEHLAGHMRGLIKQVSASLSHSGTYSRVGAVDPSKSQVVSSLDVVQ